MSIQDLLDQFGKEIVADVRKSLNDKQAAKAARKGTAFNPNSRLSASIRHEVDFDGDTISMRFIMDESYYWVDIGRKPGNVSREGRKSIERWIKRKGLTPGLGKIQKSRIKEVKNKTVKKALKQISVEKKIQGLAFVIARSISKKGYAGNYFWENVRYDGRVEQLQRRIFEEFGKQIDISFQ